MVNASENNENGQAAVRKPVAAQEISRLKWKNGEQILKWGYFNPVSFPLFLLTHLHQWPHLVQCTLKLNVQETSLQTEDL